MSFLIQQARPGGNRGPAPTPANQGMGPDVVGDFNDFIAATGGRPLLRMGEQKCLKGEPFWVSATITDNAAVTADLTLASVWDKRVQAHYSNAASRLKAVLRLAGIGFYVNDDAFRGETQALKEALDNELYLRVSRGPNTMDLPLRGRIFEPWSAFEFKQATAADAERSLFGGQPWLFERGYQIDLETDKFELRVDTAINWASGNILGYLAVYGWLGPRDYSGTGVKDFDVCSIGTRAYALASAGPRNHGLLVANGVGGKQTMGVVSPSGLRI